MKRIIISLSFLTILQLEGTAQKNEVVIRSVQRSIPVSSFDQLTLVGNFNLTLSEGDEPSIQIKGNPKFIKTFKVSQSRNRLSMKSPYTDGSSNEVVVSVKNLKKLIVQGQSVISTKGTLQSANLSVLLDAECFVTIANNGITKIETSEGFELEYLKRISPLPRSHQPK